MADETPAPTKKRIRRDSRYAIPDPLPLYVTDYVICSVLFGERDAPDHWPAFKAMAPSFERSGLPPKDTAFGNRRFWDGVRRWLDFRNGVGPRPDPSRAHYRPDGKESWK